MKLFLRGMLAFGVSAVFAVSAVAETPAPKNAPTMPGATKPAASAPVTVTAGAANCGCDEAGVEGKKRFGSRIGGRLDRAGGRVDSVMAQREAVSGRVSSFFQRLAGPPVEASAASSGGGHFHKGPHTQPGTVVFPQHPFVRSPRDFFMMD